MSEVRDIYTGKGKIVPRFQFRGWTGEDLRAFITSEQEMQHLAKELNNQVMLVFYLFRFLSLLLF